MDSLSKICLFFSSPQWPASFTFRAFLLPPVACESQVPPIKRRRQVRAPPLSKARFSSATAQPDLIPFGYKGCRPVPPTPDYGLGCTRQVAGDRFWSCVRLSFDVNRCVQNLYAAHLHHSATSRKSAPLPLVRSDMTLIGTYQAHKIQVPYPRVDTKCMSESAKNLMFLSQVKLQEGAPFLELEPKYGRVSSVRQ